MLLELAESLIEVHEDNKDPLGPQAQEAMKAMKAHQDLQDHWDYMAKEAPQECEETLDLPDHQDLQGQQAQQAGPQVQVILGDSNLLDLFWVTCMYLGDHMGGIRPGHGVDGWMGGCPNIVGFQIW